MSKASQRRLAKQQSRDKERRKTLKPFDHLFDLVCEMAFKVPAEEKWRLLCERVNPDPPHPDRADLIEWLKRLATNQQPILQVLRDQAGSSTFTAFGIADLERCQDIVTDFGGRLFFGQRSSRKVGVGLFDPNDEALLYPDAEADHHIVETILRTKLTQQRQKRPDCDMVGCLFLHFEPDLPAFFAGMTDTGATAVLVAQGSSTHVARSFAVAETGFELANADLLGPEPAEAPNQIELAGFLTTLAECDPATHNEPRGRVRKHFNEILGRAVYGQLTIQTSMANEILRLQSDLAFAHDYSDDMAEELGELSGRSSRLAKSLQKDYEKRIQQLQAQLLAAKSSAPPPRPPQTEVQSPAIEPAKPITMAERMGAFFGQG